jgi:hypothetical protein
MEEKAVSETDKINYENDSKKGNETPCIVIVYDIIL